MVAGIENIAGTQGSFVSARESAWHMLGTVLPGEFSAEEGMRIAHLAGWDVRKLASFAEETVITETGVETFRIAGKDRYFTVRTNPVTGEREFLGDVGSRYTVIQNEDHAEFLNTLTDMSGAHFETMGSLFGGTRVFMSMKLPAHITVGGDVTDMYLIALNSHDGSSEFKICVSTIRPVCHNTVTAAFAGAKTEVSMRHTRNATGRVQDAREALGMGFAYQERFQKEAEALLAQSFTDAQFDAFLASLFEVKDVEDTSTRKKNIMQDVRNLWTGSTTLEIAKNTRYGAYQAFTEYTTHFAGAHGKGQEQAINRAQRDVLDNKIRTRAFQLLSA